MFRNRSKFIGGRSGGVLDTILPYNIKYANANAVIINIQLQLSVDVAS